MKSSILGLLLCVVLVTAVSTIQTKHWFLSCRQCGDKFKECSDVCIKDSCQQCISTIEDLNCQRCVSDVLSQDVAAFYCDSNVAVHQQACRLSCRSRDVTPFFRDGLCDPDSGLCVCCKFSRIKNTEKN
jgi:hypothetical protein